MFIGHAALAMAARPLAPRANLGVAIAATYWLDLIWPVLVLAGIERVEIAPGDTAFTPLHFSHYPWSHSLAAALVWAVLFGLACWKLGQRAALVMGALVFSHWALDAISHRPDLPLWPGSETRIGLGLWNSVPATLVIEFAMFVASAVIYTRAVGRPRISFWALLAFFVLVYLGAAFGPPPPSAQAVAWSGVALLLLPAWAYWADRPKPK
ncbi:MAG TPA: metal-dependent hydrolase [Burkholderiales bacterium]|nr:metal-dependent hydrolase [Burkholderiales bacterium]